jgi:hypothetical protein
MRKLKRAWNSLAHSANAGACSPPPESAAGERRRQGLLLLRGNAKHAPESRRVAGERRMKEVPSDTGESTTDGNDLRKTFTVNLLSRETFASREHRPSASLHEWLRHPSFPFAG